MVQRTVSSKHGIQADGVKPEKRSASLKPSLQNQDGKNKGSNELKKKMKKSRSMKLSDFESLKASPLRREVPQLGEPPPPPPPPPRGVPTAAAIQQKQHGNTSAAATPQKQSLIRNSDGSPNYMKSTSSSDARKERSPVSNRNTPTSSDKKYWSRRYSNCSTPGSGLGDKPVRTLTKTSSLERVRTLTKTPSFKPARTFAKKCSKVALRADIKHAQKATCSSTQKDLKFPAYLMLNPGGTESVGTSAMKVCPYTYCSLNGHHHTPLPPLKCFMSARRRQLKTQKGMKLGALSPRRGKPMSDTTEEDTIEQMIFDDKPAVGEGDLGNSAVPPIIQEVGMDFFIEIYAKKTEDNAGNIGEGTQEGDEEIIDFSGELEDLNDTMSSDESSHYEIDCDDTLDQSRGISFIDMGNAVFAKEDCKFEAAVEDFPSFLPQDERAPECIVDGCESVSETADMDWESRQLSVCLNNKDDDSMQCDDETDLKSGYLLETENSNLNDKPVFKPDDAARKFFEDIPTEIQEELVEEESASFDEVDDYDSVSSSIHQNLGIKVSSQVSSSGEQDRHFSDENAFEELNNEIPQTESPFNYDAIICTDLPEEALMDPQEKQLLQDDDGTALLWNQLSCSQDETNEGKNESNVIVGAFESDAITEGTRINEEVLDGSLLPVTEDTETDKSMAVSSLGWEQEHPNAEQVKENKEQDDDTKSQDGRQIHQQIEVNQHDAIIKESLSSENSAHNRLPAETQDDFSEEQLKGSTFVEDLNASDKDRNEVEKFKISSTMESDEHSISGMNQSSSTGCTTGDFDSMEEQDTQLDATNAFLEAGMKRSFFHTGSNSNQELPSTRKNLNIRKKCKRSIKEEEELRKFNPREPNYLPLEPGPEAEKVDLKHQEMDDRKNAEEWMLDYALQKTVTKLAPARKRRVALLVEAYEMVMPTSKIETRLRQSSEAFAHGRPIQACS
ncbi:calmodulin binding protein PICBP [Malania oleifera]|uniref:calmodulin binding protein PICBP n=1 Tax=Malania oleifera TaxID=397392 RepID=UPI0025ADE2ED|nr:calmodulin binding protein PICBP [Malania oleifera]